MLLKMNRTHGDFNVFQMAGKINELKLFTCCCVFAEYTCINEVKYKKVFYTISMHQFYDYKMLTSVVIFIYTCEIEANTS